MPTIQLLAPDEVRALYHERMKEDFPPDELRPLFSIEQLTQAGVYFCLGYREREQGALLAYACFAKPKDGTGALLDYYAVSKNARGTGIGGLFLRAFPQALAAYGVDHVVLEVESVESAQNEADAETRRRRIRFYERNSCRMTGVKSMLFGVDYNVMTLPFDGRHPQDADTARELLDMYRLIVSPLLKTEADFSRVAQVHHPAAAQ